MSHRRERLYRVEAVILRRRDIGEADRLLTIYTPTHGKAHVIAKGARKPTSRKAGHLELFTHSSLLIAKGQTLDIVTQAEALHTFRPLRESLERATFAHYAVELLDRFAAEGEENAPLFRLLVVTLQRICESSNLPLTLLFYELRLLALEGYRPQLFVCARCGEALRPVINYFDPEMGGMLCPRCGEGMLTRRIRTVSVNALKVLRYLQSRDYDECIRLRLRAETQAEVESLMLHYVTYILERDLKSVAFLRRVREWSGQVRRQAYKSGMLEQY